MRKTAGDKQRGSGRGKTQFAEPQPVGQGQCIETVKRQKAGDKQRCNGRGK